MPYPLLEQLVGVRETGPHRWLARCPAHDDKSPSLSIRELEDRLLIHCFAGCAALDVVHAAGLELGDLFAEQLPPNQQSGITPPKILAVDALTAVSHELQVAALICADVLECKAIDEETWCRFAQSVKIISEARSHACPSRIER
jgi:hypothetical protein